jgi:hypothetical protein
MKKITIFLSLLISINIFAHSQTPTKYGGEQNKLDSISIKQIKVVPISIRNLNSYEQSYEILINGEKVATTNKLIKNQEVKLNLPIKIKEPNRLLKYEICSLSIPNNNNEMFRTKICTKAYLFWTKN